MINNLGEFWWVPVVAAAVGAFLAPIYGYYRRPRNGNGAGPTTIQGATIIDSSIARDAVAVGEDMAVALRRAADALDALVEIERARDKRAAAERHDSELETLRREIEDLKRGK